MFLHFLAFSRFMFLALQFVKCEYKFTGTVNPALFKHRMFEQYTESETGNVFYIKIERIPNSDGIAVPDCCLGILCGNTFTEFPRPISVDSIYWTPRSLTRKYCQSADFTMLPSSSNPFLKYLKETLPISVSEFKSNDLTAMLSYAFYEVYEDIPIPRFYKKVHKDSWLHSTVQTWSIYCVSPESEDSSYLSFHIRTSENIDYAYFDIYFHYGSGQVSKFTNARINLPSIPDSCDDAFDMLTALPQVKDVITKADFF
jgi:hypothetical protein